MAEPIPTIRSPTCPAPKPGSLFDQCPANYSFSLLDRSQLNNLVDGIFGSASNLMPEGSVDVGHMAGDQAPKHIVMVIMRVASLALLLFGTINHRHREEWLSVLLIVAFFIFNKTQLAFVSGNKQDLYDDLIDHGYMLLCTAIHFGLSWWFSTLRRGDMIIFVAALGVICAPTLALFHHHGGFSFGEMTS